MFQSNWPWHSNQHQYFFWEKEIFFYIQEINPIHGTRTEYAVVKITNDEFFFRVVFSEKNKEEIGQLCSNSKKNIWELSKYNISKERKFK
jgi:hypothetical protein